MDWKHREKMWMETVIGYLKNGISKDLAVIFRKIADSPSVNYLLSELESKDGMLYLPEGELVMIEWEFDPLKDIYDSYMEDVAKQLPKYYWLRSDEDQGEQLENLSENTGWCIYGTFSVRE